MTELLNLLLGFLRSFLRRDTVGSWRISLSAISHTSCSDPTQRHAYEIGPGFCGCGPVDCVLTQTDATHRPVRPPEGLRHVNGTT